MINIVPHRNSHDHNFDASESFLIKKKKSNSLAKMYRFTSNINLQPDFYNKSTVLANAILEKRGLLKYIKDKISNKLLFIKRFNIEWIYYHIIRIIIECYFQEYMVRAAEIPPIFPIVIRVV